MPSQPLISICIPVYNNARFIATTLESIVAQTHTHFEAILTDDCSTDDTISVIKRFQDSRIKLIENPANLGMIPNFEKVLSRATGKYVKLLCGDDVIYPDCLRLQSEALEDPANSGVVMAVGGSDVINGAGRVILRRRPRFPAGRIKGTRLVRASVRWGSNFIGEPGSVLFRKEAMDSVKLDSGNPYLLDMDLWAKMLMRGDGFIDKTPLAGFRVSATSVSKRLGLKQASYFRRFARKIHANPVYEVNRLDVLSGYFLSFQWCLLRNWFIGFQTRRNSGTQPI